MAVTWDGFSEEDICKLKSVSGEGDAKNHERSKKAESFVSGKKRTNIFHLKNSSVQNNISSTNDSIVNLSYEAKASHVNVSSHLDEDHLSDSNLSLDSAQNLHEILIDQTQSEDSCDTNTAIKKPEGESIKKSLTAKLVLPSILQPNPSSINLSDFRRKQRLMEEQNRARKVFLAKALEDRKKQTHAEQLRLSKIQEELQKLDQRLSCDVSIIRNQIEAASLEFMEAQKRYDRAEKEFLDAKLLLYTKLERKELLTHHLCTIIEQNEMRKAQKLSELMEKLQITEELSEIHQEVPKAEVELKQSPENQDSTNTESKRKISSEIILTPTSVVSDSDSCRTGGPKHASPGKCKEHLST